MIEILIWIKLRGIRRQKKDFYSVFVLL